MNDREDDCFVQGIGELREFVMRIDSKQLDLPLKFNLPRTRETGQSRCDVYDLSGKQIANFPIEKKGEDSIVISAEKLAAGIYLYSIVTDRSKVDLKRMIISEK